MAEHKRKFEEWKDAPEMDAGAPEPAILTLERSLILAYRTQTDEVAVIRFSDVNQHTFGYPNDEALRGHPLYSPSLRHYSFNRAIESPYLKELDRRNAISFPSYSAGFTKRAHWLVTFHDETLEIVGGEPDVLGVVADTSPVAAISQYIK